MHIKEPKQQQQKQEELQYNTTMFQVHKSVARQPIVVELEVKEKKLLIELDTGAHYPSYAFHQT